MPSVCHFATCADLRPEPGRAVSAGPSSVPGSGVYALLTRRIITTTSDGCNETLRQPSASGSLHLSQPAREGQASASKLAPGEPALLRGFCRFVGLPQRPLS